MESAKTMPPAYLSAGETDSILKRFKASREGKWKFTLQKSVEDALHLAVMLVALGRKTEALEVARFVVGTQKFKGFLSAWEPYTAVCFLAYRLAGDWPQADRESLLRDIREHPTNQRVNREFVLESVKESNGFLSDPAFSKADLRFFAMRALVIANLYLGEVESGSSYAKDYPAEELRNLETSATELLRSLLQ